MKPLPRLGRYLFAAALAAFGLQHIIYARFGTGLGPPWVLARPLAAWLMGAVLIVVSLAVASGKQARAAASALGVVLLLYAVVLYSPQIAAGIHNPGPWTSAAELLCISGATMVLAGVLSGTRAGRTILLGRVLFAAPLLVFAVQHFLYAGFIATLIPAWIPARLFFAYLVGVSFLAAAISIAAPFAGRLGAMLLGLMFFIWVLVVHIPRVAAASQNANEWTSLLVALAMCGGAWAVAGSLGGDLAHLLALKAIEPGRDSRGLQDQAMRRSDQLVPGFSRTPGDPLGQISRAPDSAMSPFRFRSHAVPTFDQQPRRRKFAGARSWRFFHKAKPENVQYCTVSV